MPKTVTLQLSPKQAADEKYYLARAAERLGGCIMLIAQKDISVEKPTPDDLYRVGTIAKIKQTVKTNTVACLKIYISKQRGSRRSPTPSLRFG